MHIPSTNMPGATWKETKNGKCTCLAQNSLTDPEFRGKRGMKHIFVAQCCQADPEIWHRKYEWNANPYHNTARLILKYGTKGEKIAHLCQADPETWHREKANKMHISSTISVLSGWSRNMAQKGKQMHIRSTILPGRSWDRTKKRLIKCTVVAQNRQADPEMWQKGEWKSHLKLNTAYPKTRHSKMRMKDKSVAQWCQAYPDFGTGDGENAYPQQKTHKTARLVLKCHRKDRFWDMAQKKVNEMHIRSIILPGQFWAITKKRRIKCTLVAQNCRRIQKYGMAQKKVN
jgi:hypothetical protein